MSQRCGWPPGCKLYAKTDLVLCVNHDQMANRTGSPFSHLGSNPKPLPSKMVGRAPVPGVVASTSTGDGVVPRQRVPQPGQIVLEEFQQQAADRAFAATESEANSRCSIRAACGAGKTVIAQELVRQQYDASIQRGDEDVLVIVATSGIDLTDQTQRAFASGGIVPGQNHFIIHSGPRAHTEAARRGARTPEARSQAERDAIKDFLLSDAPDGPKVVFVQYDSIDRLAEVQDELGVDGRASLMVLDEAHAISGTYGVKKADAVGETKSRIPPRVFHDEIRGSLQSDKRVFLTATPAVPKAGQMLSLATVEGLREFSDGEGDIKTIQMLSSDRTHFGPTVAEHSLRDVQQRGRLVAIKPSVADVVVDATSGEAVGVDGRRHRGEGRGMSLGSYASTVGALDLLSTGEGHNVLTFNDRKVDAAAVSSSIRAVAAERAVAILGHEMTERMAYDILEAPEGQSVDALRAARLTMMAHHLQAINADSSMSDAKRAAALTHFDPSSSAVPPCDCRRPGGWCACKRVLANVDLFGQGIDITNIDTVVLGGGDKQGDTALTQAVGRAMRRHEGKEHGNVVVPLLKGSDGRVLKDSEASLRTLHGVQRLWEDRSGNDTARPRDDLNVRYLSSGEERTIRDAVQSELPPPEVAAAVSQSYDRMLAAAKRRTPGFDSLDDDRKHQLVLETAAAVAADGGAKAEDRAFAEMLTDSAPSRGDVGRCEMLVDLLRIRARGGEQRTFTPSEGDAAVTTGSVSKRGMPTYGSPKVARSGKRESDGVLPVPDRLARLKAGLKRIGSAAE